MLSLSRRLVHCSGRITTSLFLSAVILLAPLPLVTSEAQAQTGSNVLATMPSPEVAFLVGPQAVSYTHLTLPTILRV